MLRETKLTEQESVTAWTRCHACSAGSGLALSAYTGEPTDCYECEGSGVVRNRDDKDRFVANPKEQPR
jgi:DnaJ-class molecular chaperone